MGVAERRKEIMRILCRRRYEKISNLAFELGVDYRTIRRDIEELSLTEPIYTKTGRYGGGVYVVEGYYIDRLYMPDSDIALLSKILFSIKGGSSTLITKKELLRYEQIIQNYTKPKLQERK